MYIIQQICIYSTAVIFEPVLCCGATGPLEVGADGLCGGGGGAAPPPALCRTPAAVPGSDWQGGGGDNPAKTTARRKLVTLTTSWLHYKYLTKYCNDNFKQNSFSVLNLPKKYYF